MRLAILGTRGIPARYGGFETFAEQLSIHLAARGIDVTVFCPSTSSRPDECYRGVTLRFIKSPTVGGFTEVLWDAKCFWAARRGFDVVYMLGVGAAFAAWIPRLHGTPVWINSDGLEWKRSKWSVLQRAYLAVAEILSTFFASRVIADAAAIERYLRAHYPFLKSVSTIAYGAEIVEGRPDENVLDEWNLRPNEYYIIVCRLEPENHLLEMVEGFERSGSNLPLVVLGNIERPNHYVNALLAHRGPRVRFLGTVYDDRKLVALRYHTRAYLHGHSVGGTNPSLLEAMACSSLVVAHDNEFNREVLGDSGLYFSTSEDLANVVRIIDSGEVDSARLRKRAAEIVRHRYSWDSVADAYLQLLDGDVRHNGRVSHSGKL
jgi:glycosyltransferase involved in cell wall biosynthesis